MEGSHPARPWIARLHRWTGLGLGLAFVLLGLTGSALVAYRALDAAAHPAVRAHPGIRPQRWAAVEAALRAADPARTGAWRIEVTPDGGVIPARYLATPQAAARGFAPRLAWVDPVSLRVVRTGQWGDDGMTWLYDLHYRLLAGPAGGRVVGAIGLGLLVLLGSGLALWWPRRARLRSALGWKRHAGPQRRVYDLHNLCGVYPALLLVLVTATGILLEFPDQVRPLIGAVGPLYRAPAFRMCGARAIDADGAVAIAARRFPEARLAWIETPGTGGVYRITLAQRWEPSQRFPRTSVWIDAAGGRVLAVRDPRDDGWGDRLLNWLHPLHNGEAFGTIGRVLVFVSGMVPAMLFATGWLRHRHKQRARAAGAARRRAVPSGTTRPSLA